VDSEVVVVVEIEAVTKLEVENHMVIVNHTTRRKEMIIMIRRRIRVMIRSKEREKATEETKKSMRTLITTSTSMHQDQNMLEPQ
jgi:hypothetical protein